MINGCGTVDVNFIVNVEPEQVKMNNVSEDIIISSVSVLPNPTTDHINFSFEAKTENTYSIEILDLNGALIYELNGNSNAATNTVKIDLAKLNLTNGYYFINLKIKDNVIHKSFIISK
ncbi:hypothetical protein SDC9_212837 [bioreactor metagenome]|uniref:Secretion system C-terminal sorting domain-containing protein n=1 Tax=bioreactor metagenome TaxID=1076179 RepID=A0A645JN21_9ZZZZ